MNNDRVCVLPMTAALLAAAGLAGCVNTRVFTDRQLAEVAQRCGVGPGDVIQDPEQPRFLFLMAISPTDEQRRCVAGWSRKHRMHLGVIDAVEWKND